MALEAFGPDIKQNVSVSDTAGSFEVDETKVQLCRRAGTAMWSHRAMNACEFRQGWGQRANIVII